MVLEGLTACCANEGTAAVFSKKLPVLEFRGKTGTVAGAGMFVGVSGIPGEDPIGVIAVCEPGRGPTDAAPAAANAVHSIVSTDIQR